MVLAMVRGGGMESDILYYRRRALAERRAAERSVTPEARERRTLLAALFTRKLEELCG